MKKIGTLDICGLKYAIMHTVTGTADNVTIDGDFIYGIDEDNSRIYLNKALSVDHTYVALLECTLVMILGHTGYSKIQSDRKLCTSMASTLMQYLRDNDIFLKLHKLRLGGVSYPIDYTTEKQMPDAYGEIDVIKTSIKISKVLKKDARALTFLHEMLHNAMHQLGQYKLYADEKFISTVSVMLFDAIIRNKSQLLGISKQSF